MISLFLTGSGSEMASSTEATSGSGTILCEHSQQQLVSEQEETTLKLKLKNKDKSTKRIQWTEDTIDNEGLGKKKSKCCCQYTKPRTNLDDSSSESEEDCEHCPGH